jgi:DNA-binding LytR/AlgR family response regulator
MKKLKCLIIDDEELARALIKSYVADVDFLELKGDFENPLEALQILKNDKIDLLFLDIQMPEIKGTEFAKIVGSETKIIFTTAYSEYALEGYELNIVDYLLKPITFTRFLTAVQKVNVINNISQEDTDEYITIKSGYDLHKVKYSDINYIKSDSEYVTFYTNGKKIMSLQSLKSLEKTIPSEFFIRVHRSYIVNKSKVSSLTGRDLVLNDNKIPISDSYYDKVKAELF